VNTAQSRTISYFAGESRARENENETIDTRTTLVDNNTWNNSHIALVSIFRQSLIAPGSRKCGCVFSLRGFRIESCADLLRYIYEIFEKEKFLEILRSSRLHHSQNLSLECTGWLDVFHRCRNNFG
jgi:hypothetical protein